MQPDCQAARQAATTTLTKSDYLACVHSLTSQRPTRYRASGDSRHRSQSDLTRRRGDGQHLRRHVSGRPNRESPSLRPSTENRSSAGLARRPQLRCSGESTCDDCLSMENEAHVMGRRRASGAFVAALAPLLLGVVVLLDLINWSSIGRWSLPRAPWLATFAAAAVFAIIGGWTWLKPERPSRSRPPGLSWWLVITAGVVVWMVAWGATSWLLAEADSAKTAARHVLMPLRLASASAPVLLASSLYCSLSDARFIRKRPRPTPP